METQLVLEKWPGVVSTVVIGAKKEAGGSRGNTVTIGGQNSLPLLFKEGAIPHKPIIAFEIWDIAPQDWPDELISAYGKAINDPLAWAEKCVNEFKAELLCVKMQGTHPDFGNKSPEKAAKFISLLLSKVRVPLIIIGSGDDAKDNLILPACSEAARGERCLIGCAVQDNYKTLVASVLADGHSIIAESPIDINIAKQLNILISDMGLSLERIVINPTIGALGYGLEYAYSIMERARLAALSGDKTLASPFICFIGQEAWKSKEARVSVEQGIIWEALTATSLIQSGTDLLIMRHPQAAQKVNNYIENLFKDKE
ncbi:MAG: acetyl-CoA decarbonylase/synthase complex subunit delta [Candidatus Omnitrophica bacterium]|nr:acetyl-CoA decarbonylase/synthase complex subunit delta [Candidatus Omnitrophota bacterium]MBU4303380.1 acetyl-CoA decarbonylase/synthase complex subunit delta [Candidatus Omnitrophota bacterium]MBU4418450.1 acetyl-CoA decarbonylase/synthase complex subunit delta [Candidatus Omnitrophota bacterium]MBU4468766.1 acetyl-CoA decarbonylase/synthase complex subunit delta [Candidatus Omnitrophota bacterium]MCG2708053.1 acetyl-CoA decarbonylase/synthase complex subunit delta [Candidatus Omnitrophota